ncbi:MAG: energy-coupled thiamine transporter ThiT [Catonella sp.]|nr:energy-coupled thiamine transporter ThiT [Catonella sp.]MDY6356214.1 energy-coupled thiamine transporter ThiT [Catonella sp.]
MNQKTKRLAYCAMAIALATVASFIKVFEFPTGGSITLFSMLFIALVGYWYGPATGIITGIAYGLLQLIIKPEIYYPAQVVLDYVCAFGALGFSGFLKDKKHGLLLGYIAAITGRWIFASLSGAIFFGEYAWKGWNPYAYSLAYNGIYIGAEAAVTIVLISIPPVKKALEFVKQKAIS